MKSDIKAPWFPFCSFLLPAFNRTEALFLSWLLNRGICEQRKKKKSDEVKDKENKNWIPCDWMVINKGLPIFASVNVCNNLISRLIKKKILFTKNINGFRHIKINVYKIMGLWMESYQEEFKVSKWRYLNFEKKINTKFKRPAYYKIFFPLLHLWKKPDLIILFHWIYNNRKTNKNWLGVSPIHKSTGLSKKTQYVLLEKLMKDGVIRVNYEQEYRNVTKRIIKVSLKGIKKQLTTITNDDSDIT